MKYASPIFARLPLIGFLLLLACLSVNVKAEVNARLSHTTSSLDEPVTLQLEIRGENDAYPDLSVLERDFEILGRSQQQSVMVINGQRSTTRGLTLTLLPKKAGQLTVPSIPVGDEQSTPLTLEVVERQPDTGAGDTGEATAFIRLDVNKTETYQQQEVILTVRLYLAQGVVGESISDPQPSLPHTQVRFLNEEQYQTQHEGRNYLLVERRYAVYAYQAGELQLGGIKFRGWSGSPPGQSLFNRLGTPFSNPGSQHRIVQATSDQVLLEILPAPAGFEGKQWLPARNLQIMESGLNSAGPLTAGKPATRHILLVADGLTASQLPGIELELPEGINQYPERPLERDTASREGISGSRHYAITLVADEAGDYQLPAVEVPWWNTETERQEVARLPAITLQVLPDQPGISPALTPQPFARPELQNDDPYADQETSQEWIDEESDDSNWLTWLLAIGWMSTLFVWWHSSRRKKASPAPTPAPSRIEQPPKDELTEIIDDLATAYRETDLESARRAWLKWGEHHWPETPPSNLSRLAERCPQDVAEAVLTLDGAIYSPANRNDWVRFSPRELLKADASGTKRHFERERLTAVKS